MNIYAIKELLLQANPKFVHHLNRYINLIEHYQKNPSDDEYTESHHILPKSMFPEYENLTKHPWNKIDLSGKAHYVAHKILWKAFRDRKTCNAFWCMVTAKRKEQDRYGKITSAEYEVLRKERAKHIKEKKVSKKTRNKMSVSQNKRYEDPEELQKTSDASKETWQRPEYREKMDKIQKSDEFREKTSKSAKKRYEDPNERRKISEINKKKHEDPEFAKFHAERCCRFIYTITKNSGEIVETTSIPKYSKLNNYCPSNLYSVLNGKARIHKDIIKITKRDKDS